MPSAPATPAALPESQHNHASGRAPEVSSALSSTTFGPRSRREWMAEWEYSNPGRPQPPSAKSVYRLADSKSLSPLSRSPPCGRACGADGTARTHTELGLQELKERAFQHIVKSLTVDNVTHEVFSAFSVAFEDVRRVELGYLFEHWAEVRKGALLSIGQQLRMGRFPGFEEGVFLPRSVLHAGHKSLTETMCGSVADDLAELGDGGQEGRGGACAQLMPASSCYVLACVSYRTVQCTVALYLLCPAPIQLCHP